MKNLRHILLTCSIMSGAFSGMAQASTLARFGAVVTRRLTMHKPSRFMSVTAEKSGRVQSMTDIEAFNQKVDSFKCLDGRKYADDETGKNSAWRCLAQTTIETTNRAVIDSGQAISSMTQSRQGKHECEQCGLLWTVGPVVEPYKPVEKSFWQKLVNLFR